MTLKSLVLVQVADRTLEPREFAIPAIGAEDALLKVERCGICGSDVEQYYGHLTVARYPLIPGHEPLGTIAQIGDKAAARWGVDVGDRVIVESGVPCRACRYCQNGQFNSCPNQQRIGYTPLDGTMRLTGGFSQYLHLPPNATVHKISKQVSLDVAATFNAMACGVGWAVHAAGTKLNDTVVILGAGQRGLASLVAAKAVGAGTTIMTGLSRDRHKLEMATRLGADHVIDVETDNVREAVRNLTGGELADIVLDLAPFATETVADAVDIVKPGGTVVLAGVKGKNQTVKTLVTDAIVTKSITIKGALGKDSASYRQAVRILESARYPLEMLHTHCLPLERAADAIEILAGNRPDIGGAPICVSLEPPH
jgi:threonine dehydrogenase-like Zn-dependent dehydrogenase